MIKNYRRSMERTGEMGYGQYFDTSIGRLYLEVEEGCLVRLSCMEGDGARTGKLLQEEQEGVKSMGPKSTGAKSTKPEEGQDKPDRATLELTERVIREVAEYLEGKRKTFDIPIHTKGTPFQEKVWAALRGIPYGETRTYGETAMAVGSPRGARAVGMACNRNPILLFTPCHRVIGSTGKLVGFAGGLEMKKGLLKLEGVEGR